MLCWSLTTVMPLLSQGCVIMDFELVQSGTVMFAAVEPLESWGLWHSPMSVRIVSLDLSNHRRWWPLSQCGSPTAQGSSTAFSQLPFTAFQGQ